MIFELPAPDADDSCPLVQCIEKRRSVREYTDDFISILNLSQLLLAAQGTTGSDGKQAIPSAGSLYPLSLHILVRRVSGLEPGIYSHQRDSHSLKLLTNEIPEAEVTNIGIGEQPWLRDAAFIICIAAKLEKSIEHFAAQAPEGARGVRYVYMESGALAQNVHLRATDLGLGAVLVAGFDDERAKKALKLPPDAEPTALICIGQSASSNA
jgi:SagB-type dehydrogenase family enzyme